MRLSEVGYKDVKRLVTITFPAIGSIMYLLSLVWELPVAKFVLGLCAISALTGGIIMVISTKRYRERDNPYDGRMVITIPQEGKMLFTLELDGDPEQLAYRRETVVFKVVTHYKDDDEEETS